MVSLGKEAEEAEEREEGAASHCTWHPALWHACNRTATDLGQLTATCQHVGAVAPHAALLHDAWLHQQPAPTVQLLTQHPPQPQCPL
jgi:hypothetical protein